MSDSDSLKVPFFRSSLGKEEEDAVLQVMRSGWLTTGKRALQFESDFANFLMSDYSEEKKQASPVTALAVNSNTSGMILAMEACGVTKGSAVITTPYTFVSTAMCARHLRSSFLLFPFVCHIIRAYLSSAKNFL